MKVNPRLVLVLGHDLAAAVLAWLGAYWLRFNLSLPAEHLASALATLAWVAPLQFAVFWGFGLYRGIWRFASLPDLKRILQAVGVAAMARSEERRVGKECRRLCRSRWSPYH
jgi:FlaA1/EpsC-like NDP-sugar epimerase